MTQSRSDIQKRSDEKRGVKAIGLKLPLETISLIKSLADESGKSQTAVIVEAVLLLAENRKI